MNYKVKKFAMITGYSLIMMALVAGFVFGYAFPKIFNATTLVPSYHDLSGNLQLYKFMLAGIVFVLLLDVLVSWSLYKYFEWDNKKLAFQAGVSRMIYSLLFGIALVYLFKNMQELHHDVFSKNYESFQKIWSIAFIFFGLHLLIVGLLMKRHKLIPTVLCYLTLIAGSSYVLIHFIKLVFPQLTELVATLNNVLGLPIALGELGLAFWLIIKARKAQ